MPRHFGKNGEDIISTGQRKILRDESPSPSDQNGASGS